MSRLCVAAVSVAVALLALPAEAGSVYLNGVLVDGINNQQFKKVDVRIDQAGNIFIDAPGYKVEVQGTPQAAPPAPAPGTPGQAPAPGAPQYAPPPQYGAAQPVPPQYPAGYPQAPAYPQPQPGYPPPQQGYPQAAPAYPQGSPTYPAGYQAAPPQGYPPPRPGAPTIVPPAAPAPAPLAKNPDQIAKRYWLVTQQTAPGLTQYDIDLYINSKWVRRLSNDDDQTILEITKYLHPGANAVLLSAHKNVAGQRRSFSPDNIYRVIIGTGNVGGDKVLIDSPLVDFQRNAAQVDDSSQEYTLTAQ